MLICLTEHGQQFESSSGFLFLYDVTCRSTFAEVMRVHALILRSKNVAKGKAKNLIPMIVLANTQKCRSTNSTSTSSQSNSTKEDTEAAPREVGTEDGLEFAYSCNCPFYKISTSNYADVLNAFQQLLGEILKHQRKTALAKPAASVSPTKSSWRKSLYAPPPEDTVSPDTKAEIADTHQISTKEQDAKEEIHESLKGRQKAFRYTRVDTEDIKYLYVFLGRNPSGFDKPGSPGHPWMMNLVPSHVSVRQRCPSS